MSEERVIEARYAGAVGAFRLDAAFTVPARGITGVFGPSGGGKTTLLRCLAGLQRLPGRLVVGDDVLQDDASGVFVPPHERRVGFVFQDANLFAHLSVAENLRYGLKRFSAKKAQSIKFNDIVSLLGLDSLLERRPERLSGGERQRVAVGRALLSQPRLLLLDEPLAALDRERRDGMLPYFEQLHGALSLPMLYVSHEMGELERLADHLVLLREGRCVAAGPLAELQADPTLWLSSRPEASTVLEGRVVSRDDAYGLAEVAVDGGKLVAPEPALDIGACCRVRVRASDVSLARSAAADSTILNILSARIERAEPLDASRTQFTVVLRLGAGGEGVRLLARVTRKSWERLNLGAGEAVHVQFKSVAVAAREQSGGFS